MMPPNQHTRDLRIHPHWAGVFPPSLYNSHPVIHQTRSIKITQPRPEPIPTSASTSSISSLVPVTPADSPGHVRDNAQWPVVGSVKNGQLAMSRNGSNQSVESSAPTPTSVRSPAPPVYTPPVFPSLDRFVSQTQLV